MLNANKSQPFRTVSAQKVSVETFRQQSPAENGFQCPSVGARFRLGLLSGLHHAIVGQNFDFVCPGDASLIN